jgi:sugar transferase (PEP-CTERM/EpsH1 system associated)
LFLLFLFIACKFEMNSMHDFQAKTTAHGSGDDGYAGRDILVLCQRVPYPPNKGDRIRTFNIIQYLFKNGWRVHLATLLDSPDDAHAVDGLRTYCASIAAVYLPKWRRYTGLWRSIFGSSLSVEYFHSRHLQRHVHALLTGRKISAALAVSAPMVEYLRRSSGSCPRRMVLDLVDVDSEKWRAYAVRGRLPMAWVHALEGRLLARYEEKAGATCGSILLISQSEADLMRPRTAGRFAIHVVPNGVDATYFSPACQEAANASKIMVFCGAMDYPPNIEAVDWFATQTLPRIRRVVPEARLCIAGSNPTADVKALARLPGVTVTGTVPDIRPMVQEAAVSVAPMRLARGVQNKVLEAMAMGKAVLATPQALEGLDVVAGETADMASDEPEAFARAAIDLLLDDERRRLMGRRAREWVVEHHAWDACLKPLEGLLV